MKWRLLLSLLLAAACAGPALAGLFGKKPVKPNPIDRVPELIHILKNDSEENKRVEAAEELRQFDPTKFPQIFVALIDALQNDPKPAVRSEAAQSLGKLRPVSKMVRQALEHARDKDPSMRVRLQARSSLLSYYWAGGYNTNLTEPPIQSKEPPIGGPQGRGVPPVIRTQPDAPVVPGKDVRFDPALVPQPGAPKPQPVKEPIAPAAQQGSSFFRFLGSSKPAMKTTEPPLAPPVPTPSLREAAPVPAKQPISTQPAASPPEGGPELGPPPR